MLQFLRNTPTKFLLVILCVLIALTLVAIQASGLDRSLGLWLFAALAMAETALILGPRASMAMGGRAKFIRFFLIMLAIGAGIYGYVSFFMVPKAIVEASAEAGKN
jgi:hypothetical protein